MSRINSRPPPRNRVVETPHRVEIDTVCRNQHGKIAARRLGMPSTGDRHFDHALTECKTGVRRNPGRAGVRGPAYARGPQSRGSGRLIPLTDPWRILDSFGRIGASATERNGGEPAAYLGSRRLAIVRPAHPRPKWPRRGEILDRHLTDCQIATRQRLAGRPYL